MFRIAKAFRFSAAHRLLGMPEGHPCGSLHGHNYTAEFVFEAATLDARGFADVDYRELDPVKRWLDDHLDHRAILCSEDPILPAMYDRDLSRVYILSENPTAETLAAYLFVKARCILGPLADHLIAVRVSETPNTWAEYREG